MSVRSRAAVTVLNMREIDRFKVLHRDEERCFATLADAYASVRVKGFYNYRQFEIEHNELLFVLTNADPWEPIIVFNLVDRDLRLVEWIALGARFGDGVADFLSGPQPSEMRMRFRESRAEWSIKVEARARTRYLP